MVNFRFNRNTKLKNKKSNTNFFYYIMNPGIFGKQAYS